MCKHEYEYHFDYKICKLCNVRVGLHKLPGNNPPEFISDWRTTQWYEGITKRERLVL